MPINTAIKLQALQERFKSDTEVYFVKALDDAMSTIMAKIIKTDDSLQKKRLKAIKALIEQEVHALYSGVIDPLSEDMTQFAHLSYDTLFGALNTELGVGYAYASLPKSLIKEIINMDSIILMGDRAVNLNDLLHASTLNQIERYKQIITGGLAANVGYSEITRNLRNANGTSFKEMQAVVHTAISSARSKADGKAYARFGDLVKGWESVAVLDSRTTLICASLDGKRYFKSRGYEWENIPNKPPRHFRCRSVLVSITGSKIDNTRSASGDKKGQISDKIKFKDWFGSQSSKFQKSYLGQGRYNLYKKGKFEINSFVDVKSGEVFTIQELKEMI